MTTTLLTVILLSAVVLELVRPSSKRPRTDWEIHSKGRTYCGSGVLQMSANPPLFRHSPSLCPSLAPWCEPIFLQAKWPLQSTTNPTHPYVSVCCPGFFVLGTYCPTHAYWPQITGQGNDEWAIPDPHCWTTRSQGDSWWNHSNDVQCDIVPLISDFVRLPHSTTHLDHRQPPWESFEGCVSWARLGPLLLGGEGSGWFRWGLWGRREVPAQVMHENRAEVPRPYPRFALAHQQA
jgi:hypothetical protein